MPAEVDDVKLPVKSSTTDTADVSEESSPLPNFEPSTYTPEQVREWKNTGAVPEIPAPPKPKAESAPAKQDQAGASDEEDEPVAESAPVVKQQEKVKGRSNADTRKAELNREIQDLIQKRNALKAEVTAPATPVKTDVIPESSPTPKLPKVDKPDKPKKPVWGEISDEEWDQFEKRRDQYEDQRDEYQEKMVAYTLAQDRLEREKERREAETATQNRAIEQSWNSRVKVAKGKPGYENYDTVIAPLLAKDSPIPVASYADAFILDSDVGPELLHYFGEHLDEAEAVGHMNPIKASRILTMVEQAILQAAREEAEPEPKRSDPPPKPKPVAVPLTKAARPATDIKAVNAAPVSEIEAAVANDDFTRFRKIRDHEDIERRKRG